MMQTILIDGDDALELDKLCRDPMYLQAPFYGCPACREDRPHARLVWPFWANTLLAIYCIGGVVLLDVLGHSPLGVIFCATACLITWYVIRPLFLVKQEEKARLLAHAQLEKDLDINQKRARMVHLIAFSAQFRFKGPAGYLTLVEAEMDSFLQQAQAMQYRLRVTNQAGQDLSNLLGVMARMGQRRNQLREFSSQTLVYLTRLNQDAEMLEIAYSRAKDDPFSLGPLHNYMYLLLYSHLKQYEQYVREALTRARIPGLTERCLKADPPDLAALERALDSFFAGLPDKAIVPVSDLAH